MLSQAAANPTGAPASAQATAGAPGATGAAGSYPYLPLVVAALGHLLDRTHTYLDQRLSPGLAAAGQQLINQAAVAAAAGGSLQGHVSADHVRPVAGLLHGAAALLVELARATAANPVTMNESWALKGALPASE